VTPALACPQCARPFYHKSKLKKHLRIHPYDPPLPCNQCDNKFTYYQEFLMHRAKDHPATFYPFPCSLCDQRFDRESSRTRHLEAKHFRTADRYPYLCNICGFRYRAKVSLQHHLRIHGNEKPFQCGKCDKKFAEISMLKRHDQIHMENRKIFDCEECGKKYLRKDSLVRHQRQHKKPLPCDFCSQTFSEETLLSEHRLGHIGEIPFKCSNCGRAWKNAAALKRHRTASLKNPLCCIRK
jgi:uncharacterized Zn-finger protein